MQPDARMVVYAPDFDTTDHKNEDRLEQQLAMLRTKFDGLVLYGCGPQSRQIVLHAVAMGYRAVLLTVWDPRSRKELQTASELIDSFQYRTALAVSIGSEGLMQQRYTVDDLLHAKHVLTRNTHMRETIEVTTTEPWWMYLHRGGVSEQLTSVGDFVTANVHVVWDTDIRDPTLAADWTMSRSRELQQALHHVVLVREAGFPGSGYSPREDVQLTFTRQMQADFWKALQRRQKVMGGVRIPVVAFEAFNNSSKQWDSFEGAWGLINAEGIPYPAWKIFTDLGTPEPVSADATVLSADPQRSSAGQQ